MLATSLYAQRQTFNKMFTGEELNRPSDTCPAHRIGENSQVQPIQIKVNGVNVGSTITPTSSFATYNSADFTVSAGNHTISLSATDASGDKASMVDDIKVF